MGPARHGGGGEEEEGLALQGSALAHGVTSSGHHSRSQGRALSGEGGRGGGGEGPCPCPGGAGGGNCGSLASPTSVAFKAVGRRVVGT